MRLFSQRIRSPLFVLLVAAGCAAAPRPQPSPSDRDTALETPGFVPDQPPDTVSWDVWRNSALDGAIARDMIVVAFKPGTTTADKRQVIAAVNGHVIGGFRVAIGEGGLYVIRIPDPGDAYMEVLQSARERMTSSPVVHHVGFYIRSDPASRP